jgi:hypothetical protein
MIVVCQHRTFGIEPSVRARWQFAKLTNKQGLLIPNYFMFLTHKINLLYKIKERLILCIYPVF